MHQVFFLIFESNMDVLDFNSQIIQDRSSIPVKPPTLGIGLRPVLGLSEATFPLGFHE